MIVFGVVAMRGQLPRPGNDIRTGLSKVGNVSLCPSMLLSSDCPNMLDFKTTTFMTYYILGN